MAKYYQQLEDEAMENGEVETIFVEEYRCEICKKKELGN
jgi:hypothetical protein